MNTVSQLDVWSQHETTETPQRLVLLGASNLARALPTVVSLARTTFAGPLSIYAAHGLGRSYGLEAGNLGKKYPGIFFSGLWSALETKKSAPTAAWITDVGNDLAYEVSVERVIEWVGGCVERLEALGARITIVDLPIETLRGVGAIRYRIFRTLYFPWCRLDWADLIARACALSESLHALSRSRKIPIFPARNEWYGLDPIHPRKRHLAAIWRELLGAPRGAAGETPLPRDWWLRAWRVRRLKPETWTHFSISRSAAQPCARLHDGLTIALY